MDRYESDGLERKQLSGRTQRQGSQTGIGLLGTFLFGGVFVAAGGAIVLVGLRVIPVDPESVHAPYWVLAAFGATFMLAGLMVWSMGIRQAVMDRNRREAQAQHPGEPALADYPWNPRMFQAARWKKAIGSLFGTGFLALFLSMFNYWAFGDGGPLPVKVVVGLFDLILVFAAWQTVILFGRALKFGGSAILFDPFPYRHGEPVVIHWMPAEGIDDIRKGTFTLRCLKEWFESTGSGKDRSSTMVHEQQWGGTWCLDKPRTLPRGRTVDLRFEPPPEAPPTRLNASAPVFWEFEVKLDLPGFDFEETYLVPVYSRHETPSGSSARRSVMPSGDAGPRGHEELPA